jgi:hypothetical protein
MVTSRHSHRALVAAVGLCMASGAAGIGCQPEFDDRASFVGAIRVLGVRSDPAEAAPSTTIQYTALVGDTSGTRTDVPLDWAYCTLPKPVSETNDINVLCFSSGDFIKPFQATGESVSADIPLFPDNACNQFGPDLPTPLPGQPPGRPADPDSTGGYYQPIRISLNRGNHFDFTVAETRLVCNLPGATAEVLLDFQKRYRGNQNPALTNVVASTAAGDVELTTEDLGDSGLVVAPGTAVRLSANWNGCPVEPACGDGFCEGGEDATACPEDCTTPKGCDGAESYVFFDLATRTLLDRREAIRVSWYANAGGFADDRTGRTEEESSVTSSPNTWTAPTTAGTYTMWVVIRDSRGGTGWKSYRITVQ